jgi:hypothetical protein
MSLPKIIDNKRKILADVLKQLVSEYNEISIATGYWDIHGIKEFLDSFKSYKKIRLLIGRELLIPRHKLNRPEPDYPDRDIFQDLEALSPDKELISSIKAIKELIEKDILEVRVYRQSFLHAKSYIFGNFESSRAIGIIGSSNFTGNGLNSNTELNALEADERLVLYAPKNQAQETGYLFWFNELWEDEKQYYRHPQYPSQGIGGETGHYTQIINKNVTEIGCACANCNGSKLCVCRYDPIQLGNQYPY